MKAAAPGASRELILAINSNIKSRNKQIIIGFILWLAKKSTESKFQYRTKKEQSSKIFVIYSYIMSHMIVLVLEL